MNRMGIWFFAGLLGAALPLSLQASEDEHTDHDVHESEQGEAHGEGGVHLTPEQQEMAGVVVETLQLRDIVNELRAPGEIQLNDYATTRVVPRIAAQVLERQARLGDSIEKGDALVMLSSVEMAQAQGDLLVAEREWRRVSELGRDVVSEQRYTEARIKREQARARVSAYGMTEDEIKELVASGNAKLANGRFQLLSPQDGTDIYFARQLVFERLQAAREQIPDGIGTPEMGPNTSGLGQVYQYILRTDDPGKYDALTLRSLNDWVVKLLLMPVGGVTDVLSFGGEVRQYQVQLDPQRLLAYGLGIDEVTAAVEANNRNAGGWYLDRGAEQLVIRGVGWLRSGEDGLRDLGNISLKDVDGVPVRVQDVASIEFGPEIRQGAVTMTGRDTNGKPEPLGEVVTGIVLKRMGANTKAAIDGIKERLPAIQMALPEGVILEPVYDQSDLVSQAVNTVSKALLEAFVLIIIVLMLFLVNLRASFLVLISVPISIGLALMAFPEVLYVSSRVGRAEIGGDPEPVSNVEIFVGLKPVSEWVSAPDRETLQVLMEEKLLIHPGLLFSFSQPIATRVDELLSGVKAQLAIKLFGPDLDGLATTGKAIEALVRKVDGTRGVEMEQIAGEAQLVLRPDRDALARYGVPVAQVMDLVSDAIGGREAGQVIKGNERYDIYVRLDESYRDSIEAIRSLILQAPNGSWLRLGDVAQVAIESGPPQIRRDDVQRRVVIQANVDGRDMGGLVSELRERISSEIDLPSGYSIVFGGQFENQQRAQARLMIVVPLSLGLIFLLLYFAFNSIGQALLIMLNVPLALIGGIAALFFSGQYLSVPGSIGFIALFGVAVLNGVVMVSAINQRLKGGLSLDEAVFEGAFSRLRPVLMTANIAALGLIPMLLSSGVGSEVQRPLATVVVGGLFSSTLLTLFVLPSLYRVFSGGMIRD